MLAVLLIGILVLFRDRLPIGTHRQPALINLYCYSVLSDVMEDGLLPKFRAKWLQETGRRVEFVTTFSGSASLVARILRDHPAQVAILSSELDAYRAPLQWESWKALPNGGILGRTPLVILVREGNPKGILDFRDLSRQDMRVVHSDPATSGGGYWAVLAAFGSSLDKTGDADAAIEQLRGIWSNVALLTSSAREARLRFEEGIGDALITYEQDLLGNPSRSRPRGEIVYPRRTVLAEPVVAKITKYIGREETPLIDAFVDFLWSTEAQETLVRYGLRSPYEDLNTANPELGVVEETFTLESLGGAARVRRDILEAAWRNPAAPEQQ